MNEKSKRKKLPCDAKSIKLHFLDEHFLGRVEKQKPPRKAPANLKSFSTRRKKVAEKSLFFDILEAFRRVKTRQRNDLPSERARLHIGNGFYYKTYFLKAAKSGRKKSRRRYLHGKDSLAKINDKNATGSANGSVESPPGGEG